MHLNHPETILPTLVCGKIVFHEIFFLSAKKVGDLRSGQLPSLERTSPSHSFQDHPLLRAHSCIHCWALFCTSERAPSSAGVGQPLLCLSLVSSLPQVLSPKSTPQSTFCLQSSAELPSRNPSLRQDLYLSAQ